MSLFNIFDISSHLMESPAQVGKETTRIVPSTDYMGTQVPPGLSPVVCHHIQLSCESPMVLGKYFSLGWAPTSGDVKRFMAVPVGSDHSSQANLNDWMCSSLLNPPT